MPNPLIDLTTIQNVWNWAASTGPQQQAQIPSNDQDIIDLVIADLSLKVITMTGRGPASNIIDTTQSPFVAPVIYTEDYDGSGSGMQLLRNWPIRSVQALTINGVTIPQSTSFGIAGFLIDTGARFLRLRGGSGSFSGYNVNFLLSPQAQFCQGVQNVNVQYTAGFDGIPPDLKLAVTRTASLKYVSKRWQGKKSDSLAAGAGTTSYADYDFYPDDLKTILNYARAGLS